MIKIFLTKKSLDQAFERKVILNRLSNHSVSFCRHIFKYLWADEKTLLNNEENHFHWLDDLMAMMDEFYFVENKSGIKKQVAFDLLMKALETEKDYERIYNVVSTKKGGKHHISIPLKENAKYGAIKTLSFINNDFKKVFYELWENDYSDYDLVENKLKTILDVGKERTKG